MDGVEGQSLFFVHTVLLIDSMAGADQQDADEFFKDKKAMTVSELAILLGRHVQSRKAVDPDYEPNLLLKKTLEYTQQFASNRNEETTKRMRQWVVVSTHFRVKEFNMENFSSNQRLILYKLSRFAEAEGLEEREFCIISNLGIQTSDEAKKLIPSLEVSDPS